ncbi:MAG: rane protein [Patescibacteria group bacterium]|nr:rane protein [Patescibacteria group bacterium]
MKKILEIFLITTKNWLKNIPFTKSASISYYFLFSLPVLLYIIVKISTNLLGEDLVTDKVYSYVYQNVGPESALSVKDMISNFAVKSNNLIYFIIGAALAILSSTASVVQLRNSLETIFGKRDTDINMKSVINQRATSLLWILIIGAVLIIFFVASTILQIFIENILSIFTSLIIAPTIILILNNIFTFIIMTSLIFVLFKISSKDKIGWQNILVGSSITSLLFMLGKYLIVIYFTSASPTLIFGAASSIALLLLWVNYMCLILFWGAELTKTLKTKKLL